MNYSLCYISPELILAIGGIIALIAGAGLRARTTPSRLRIVSPEVVSIAALVVALVASVMLLGCPTAVRGAAQFVMGREKYGLMAVDGFAIFFKIIALVSTIMVALLSVDYFRGIRIHRGEYYALLIFATLAITTLAASTDLIMIYLSLEFLSITSYILAGYMKQDPKSNEAAVKYFLYGSIAAAVMIYGMTMLYGLTGTTNILLIADAFRAHPAPPALMFLATLLVLVGLGFKIAMVPFHQWAPDTYEGAPTPITAFLSVGSKAAGFAVLIRVLGTSLTPHDVFNWTPLIIILSGITMTVGNLVAISQTNIKRMLAYSSIAHAGYLLVGVAAMGIAYSPGTRTAAVQAILMYIIAYLFMNLGAFAVVTMIGAKLGSDDIRAYAGLIKRSPWAAVAMVFFLMSLAGVPPTAGFLGKFYVFLAAIQAARQSASTALFWLLIVAIANTVVSVYYYFNVVREMFFVREEESLPVTCPRALGVVIGVTLVMTVLVLILTGAFAHIASVCASIFTLAGR